MSYAGNPQDNGIGQSLMGNGNPWMRNMMLAQMLMRGQQQPQGQGPWSSLAGAGGNIIQAMEMQKLLSQQNPNQPGPTPQPPMASRPPTPLGMTGQPGMSPLTPSNIPLSGQNFAGGIAPFGTSGTGGIY